MNAYVRELVDALVAQRTANNIKKSAIAVACNVPISIITHVERGEIEPTFSLLLDYAGAVKKHLTWQLTEKPPISQCEGDPHCAHWSDGDGPCCRCGEPNWCPESGETPEALAHFEDREWTCQPAN